jgi:hypothetical protein
MALHEPFGHLQYKLWMKEKPWIKLPIWLLTTKKFGNRPDPNVCRSSATHHWKALKEIYKFSLDFIPIGGLSKELWTPKVSGVQTGAVLGLLFGSSEKKCHLDVGAMGKHREYFMGEGDGFPRVRAVVSHISPRSPVACPSIESVPECDLTNLLVGLM